MKPSDLPIIVRGIAPVIRAKLKEPEVRIAALEDEVRDLKAELVALKAELAQTRDKSMTFKGPFVNGDFYRQNEVVEHADALYIARKPTMRSPADREAWALVAGRKGAA